MKTKLDNQPWLHNRQRNFTYEFVAELMGDVVREYPMGHRKRAERWNAVSIAIKEANACIYRMIKGY